MHSDLSYKIIGCCFEVYNNLGAGYPEADYQTALVAELESQGLSCKKEYSTELRYKGIPLKKKRLDILVADEIILELKIGVPHYKSHIAQLISYLKAIGKESGLLVYFNQGGVNIKRVINTVSK